MYNDKLVYKVVIWVFWGLFYEKKRNLLLHATPVLHSTVTFEHIPMLIPWGLFGVYNWELRTVRAGMPKASVITD